MRRRLVRGMRMIRNCCIWMTWTMGVGQRRFWCRTEGGYQKWACTYPLIHLFRNNLFHQVKVTPTPASYLAATRSLFPPLYPPGSTPTTTKPAKSQTAQLISLLRVAFPSVRSKQAMFLLFHSAFLVLRTYLSVLVAKLDGKIVRDLVSESFSLF